MLIDEKKFAEDIAFLIKPNGTQMQIMAEIQTKTAFISDIETPIEIGDLLVRPRGSVSDTYEVVNILPWSKADHSFTHIPPHIQATIVPYRKKNDDTSHALNVNGNITASTVVINSGNNASINVSAYDNFNNLVKALETVSAPKEIIDSVRDLEANVKKPNFKEKYTNFVASLANHVTVLQAAMPFMPWLSSL